MKKVTKIFLLSLVVLFTYSFSVLGLTDTKSATVTATVDPTIVVTLSTNTISFGTVDLAQAETLKDSVLNVTVKSNTNYKLTAQASDDLKDGVKTITIDKLQLKEHGQVTWNPLSKATPVTLLDNQLPTNSTVHTLDFKLVHDVASMEAGNYSANVNITASTL